MSDARQELLDLIKANDGINDKARLARIVANTFHLSMDRSVYYWGPLLIANICGIVTCGAHRQPSLPRSCV